MMVSPCLPWYAMHIEHKWHSARVLEFEASKSVPHSRAVLSFHRALSLPRRGDQIDRRNNAASVSAIAPALPYLVHPCTRPFWFEPKQSRRGSC